MFRDEIAYVSRSKAVYVLIAFVSLLVAMGAYSDFAQLRVAHEEYEMKLQEMAALGVDVDAALTSDLNVTETVQPDGNVVTGVDNPVRYAFEQVGLRMRALAPSSLVSSALALVAFIGGPIVFGLWGVFLATYDFVNKTVKLKAIRSGWTKVVATKLLVGASGVVATVGLILALVLIGSGAIYNYAVSTIPDHAMFNAAVPPSPGLSAGVLLAQSGVAVATGWLFMTLGFALGIATRNPYPPMALVVAYNVFVPILGSYDLKNLVAVLGHQVFTFGSTFQLAAVRPVPVTTASLVIAAVIAVSSAASLYTASVQSKYID